jgi:hypothetical protein
VANTQGGGKFHKTDDAGVPGDPVLESRLMGRRERWLPILLVLTALAAGGCGITGRIAVSSMVPILEKTVESVYRDQDLETVQKGIPANLLLLRGLCESSPGNDELWSLTVQLYFYYGFGFVEDENAEEARLVYLQGLDMGRRSLSRRGWFHPDKSLEQFSKGLAKAKREDVPLLFWTAANWASWINLSMNDPAAVADLPMAEALLGRVLELDGGYFRGLPHAMAGTLEATKPVMMGGNPESSRAHFEAAFEASGRKLLIFQTLYAQYYCRAVLDQEEFVRSLDEVLKAPVDIEPEYRLLNEVARRKAARLMEQKDDLF